MTFRSQGSAHSNYVLRINEPALETFSFDECGPKEARVRAVELLSRRGAEVGYLWNCGRSQEDRVEFIGSVRAGRRVFPPADIESGKPAEGNDHEVTNH